MADPFSILVGAVGITAAIVSTSQAVLQLLEKAKAAPQETSALARDVHAFYTVVLSLNAMLKHNDLRTAIGDDGEVVEMIGNLKLPLADCQVILEALASKVQQRLKSNNGTRLGLAGANWDMLKTSEVRALRRRLKDTKDTLAIALGAVTSLCGMRLLAMATVAIPTLASPSSGVASSDGLWHETHPTSTSRSLARTSHRQCALTSATEDSELPEYGDLSEIDTSFTLMSRSDSSKRSSVDEWYAINEIVMFAEGLDTTCSGSPSYYFERKTSFYPEKYTAQGLFNDPVFVVAMMPSEQDQDVHKYFLLYAETPRRWRRVIVSATILDCLHDGQDSDKVLRAVTPDNGEAIIKHLPTALGESLRTRLSNLRLFDTITRISIRISKHDSGHYATNITEAEAEEDLPESRLCDEALILQEIEDSNCERFLESEVIVQSRISSSCYVVKVGSYVCTERMTPFASAGLGKVNGFDHYVGDLRLLRSLRGCKGIAEFIGVVLDDTRLHLKGYLYGHAALGSVRGLLRSASHQGETIPLFIRLAWAIQLVEAVTAVHSRGITVGGEFTLQTIGVKADGSIILDDLKAFRNGVYCSKGRMVPEFQGLDSEDGTGKQTVSGFRVDIFKLAFPMWILAENTINDLRLFCERAGCTTYPRHTCTASHTSPIELPECSKPVPSYINDIIRGCRSRDPKDRPTARQILDMVPGKPQRQIQQHHVNDILIRYAGPQEMNVFCDVCFTEIVNQHYHCGICRYGDFDLCPDCVEHGIHCLVAEHKLVERIKQDGCFAVIS